MAQALVLPLIERGEFLPEQVFAVVGQSSTAKNQIHQLPRGISLLSSDDPAALRVWASPIQLLAVKPQQLREVIAASEAAQGVGTNTQEEGLKPLLVSLLAGVSIERLEQSFPNHICVRAVPNTPALVGAGLTGLSWGKDVTDEQRVSVRGLFRPISEILECPESQLDAFLALTSSGPAYVALIAEALADGAVAAGLPRELAQHLAHRMLAGTAALLKEKELHPGQLKDMVASPGGTTITALRHLEKGGIRSALIEAVVAAAERSREMA